MKPDLTIVEVKFRMMGERFPGGGSMKGGSLNGFLNLSRPAGSARVSYPLGIFPLFNCCPMKILGYVKCKANVSCESL